MRGKAASWYDVIDPRVILALPAADVSTAVVLADRRAIKNVFQAFGRVKNERDGREVIFPAASVGKMWFNSGVDIRGIASEFANLFRVAVRAWSEGNIPRAEVHASVVSSISIYKTEGAELSTPIKTQAEDSAPFVDDKIALFLSRVNVPSDVAVIILIKDEKLHIRRCLERLRNLNPRQIFIVDCFSGDGSVELAKETAERLGLNLQIVQRKWPGLYAPQLNWALENLPIEAEWVMRLDADEYFLPEAIDELKEKLPTLSMDVTGVISKRRHYIFGGWAKHGTYPVKLLRVFRRGKAFCEERYMDEHMQLREGRAVEFQYDFVDHNLNSFEWWKQKHRGYAKREAMDALEIMAEIKSGKTKGIKIDGQAAAKRAKKYRYYKLPRYVRAVAYFCIRYFLKGGFLDGKAGWKWNFWQGLWYRWIVDREIGGW